MNPAWAKEIRPLAIAGLVAAGTGVLVALRWSHLLDWQILLSELCLFAFGMSFALLSTLPFGTEFHHRTLPLLLVQPLERLAIWRRKALTLFAASALVVLVLLGVMFFTRGAGPHNELWVPTNREEPLFAAVFVLATACSAAFWTLVARSTIGGMMFTLCSEFFAVGCLEAALGGSERRITSTAHFVVLLIAALAYSAGFLWLGRRKFARLELRHPVAGEGGVFETGLVLPFWQPRWLRCRPQGGIRNLARKELRLQKPAFTLALIFCLGWLFTLILLQLPLSRRDTLESILNVLTAFYLPLVIILAGCISMGEEKTLGLGAWHLTLPVSAWRQWVVKLLLALLAGTTLGVILPLGLGWLTSSTSRVGLFAATENSEMAAAWMAICFLGVIVSFWAGTLFAGTVRAALATIAGLVFFGMCMAFGAWRGEQTGGLQTGLLRWLASHCDLSPDFLAYYGAPGRVIWVCLAILAAIALAQSYALFRRPDSAARTIWSYVALLAVASWILGFWWSDLGESASRQRALESETSTSAGGSFSLPGDKARTA